MSIWRAGARRQLVIGGLVTSTALTLVLPTLYAWMETRTQRAPTVPSSTPDP